MPITLGKDDGRTQEDRPQSYRRKGLLLISEAKNQLDRKKSFLESRNRSSGSSELPQTFGSWSEAIGSISLCYSVAMRESPAA